MVSGLEVHTPQYAARATGLVVLDKLSVNTRFLKRSLIPRLKEIAPVITENTRGKYLKTRDRSSREQGQKVGGQCVGEKTKLVVLLSAYQPR